jgi:ribosome-associated heat shock protein Hsp15
MDDQRLDKWLWCARFFPTRNLAQAAIRAGHITVNGQRAKPSRALMAGDRLSVLKSPYTFELEVMSSAPQRLSASLAQQLYRESDASRQAREKLAEQLRLGAVREAPGAGRLDRRDRRERVALKRLAADGEGPIWHE